MRFAFAGIALLALVLALWLFPWIPFGMTTENYGGGVAGALILSFATFITSLLFVIVWGPAFRNESVPEFLRVLFGAQQLIRGRSQFYSRIAIECARARKDRRKMFALMVVQLPANGSGSQERWDEDRQIATMLARSIIRSQDVVGDSWPHEVWLLAVGAGPEACSSIIQRLGEAFQRSAEPFASLSKSRMGMALFGVDGEEPEDLFAAAYQRLEPLNAGRKLQAVA